MKPENETWNEFMDRAKANGLSPTRQGEVDRRNSAKKETKDVRRVVDMFNDTKPCRYAKTFDEIPDVFQRQYRSMYNLIGYGECEDCGWNAIEGCNVERDSSVCRLNKRLKSAEWQKQISSPRLPVMDSYNISESIMNSDPETILPGYGIPSYKNVKAHDFSPSSYVMDIFGKQYMGYHYINFVDISNNNSVELYHKLLDDSADGDYSGFETLRLMFGINSGVLVIHFPLLTEDDVQVSGTCPISRWVVYAKETADRWKEMFLREASVKQYLNNYIRSFHDKSFSPTHDIYLSPSNTVRTEDGVVVGICGDSKIPEGISVLKNQNHEEKFRAFARDVIKCIVEKSKEYGITMEEEVKLFLELSHTRAEKMAIKARKTILERDEESE